MHLPSPLQRQRLTAHQTFPVLPQPKITRCPTTLQGAGHLGGQTLFKIEFPARIVRIGVSSDFHVTTDGRGPGLDQQDGMVTAFLVQHRTSEPPTAIAWPSEV